MAADPPPAPPSAAKATLARRREDLATHAAEVAQVQTQLAEDVDDLHDQEGWKTREAAGVDEWVADRGMVFRALRRHHFDVAKTQSALLTTLSARLARGLSGGIPPPPGAEPLFALLPPPCVDRLGHPVAVLTLRAVVRDEAGSLLDLKEWVWWGLELVRRAVKDYWVDKRRGTGAEGAVLLVDVSGAGYRNMEVELLPTLFSVGHNHFPGLFEAVYVANAGWSHRAMWNSVVRRVLPTSAVDKVSFLDDRAATESVFDLDRLPKEYGGDGPPVDHDIMLRRYAYPHPALASRPGSRAVSRTGTPGTSRAASRANSRGPSRNVSRNPSREPSMTRAGVAGPSHSQAPSRTTSAQSLADVYYTAPGTPTARSRNPSRRGSIVGANHSLAGLSARLAMTKSREPEQRLLSNETAIADDDDEEPKPMPALRVDTAVPASTIQRIKSLSDFHLYLSPSRLAHRDLLSDSEDEGGDDIRPRSRRTSRIPVVDTPQKRRELRPALLDTPPGSLAARRAAARARAALPNAHTPQENYASKMQELHADRLEKYCEAHGTDSFSVEGLGLSPRSSSTTSPAEVSTESSETDVATPEADPPSPCPENAVESHAPRPAPAQAAYSAENPWFGYPVSRDAGGRLRPVYGRNRKRDLAKTLLWLFILRLQAWRDAFERALGLYRFRRRKSIPETPGEGLVQSERRRAGSLKGVRGAGAVGRHRGDFIWMAIGFLLVRGTWANMVGDVLEGVGLTGVREVLGLV